MIPVLARFIVCPSAKKIEDWGAGIVTVAILPSAHRKDKSP
jgi:hypothetical protein